MTDGTYKSSPESTDPNALEIAILTLNLSGKEVKIPYGALVDYPTYVAALINSPVGANKNHLTIWNGSTKRIRIRKIEVMAEITANVTGATSIMVSVEALSAQPTGGTPTNIPVQKLATWFEAPPAALEVRSGNTTVPIAANWVIARKPLHIEESPTTTADHIDLFKKDTEISSIQLEQNQGVVIKQGSVVGVGAVSIMVYMTPD